MDIKIISEYIKSLPDDELQNRLEDKDGTWGEECKDLCFLELKKRGRPMEDHRIRLDSAAYDKWINDPVFMEGCKNYSEFNYEKALCLFNKSAISGNMQAMTYAGLMHFYGCGTGADSKTAFKYLATGCSKDYPLSAMWLSEFYRLGIGTEKDGEKSAELYMKYKKSAGDMCLLSDPECLFCLGCILLYNGHNENNCEKGLEYIKNAALQNHANAVMLVAKCYSDGFMCKKNSETALKMLEDFSKKRPDPAVCFMLGEIYYEAEKYKEALEMFMSASGHGNYKACINAGNMFYEGKGTEQDYEQALLYYKKAEAIYPLSAEILLRAGDICFYGEAGDTAGAISFYERAAAAKSIEAIIKLLDIYKKSGELSKAEKLLFSYADEKTGRVKYLLYEFYRYTNPDLSESCLKESAAMGYYEAEEKIALLFENSDEEMSEKLYEHAAETGSINAAIKLSEQYFKNKNKEQGRRYKDLALNNLFNKENATVDEYYNTARHTWIYCENTANLKITVDLFLKAFYYGRREVCFDLAVMIWTENLNLTAWGYDVKTLIEEIYEYSAGANNPVLTALLMSFCENRPDKCIKYLYSCQESEIADELFLAGLCRDRGKGLSKSRHKARALYKAAALKGSYFAEAALNHN